MGTPLTALVLGALALQILLNQVPEGVLRVGCRQASRSI